MLPQPERRPVAGGIQLQLRSAGQIWLASGRDALRVSGQR